MFKRFGVAGGLCQPLFADEPNIAQNDRDGYRAKHRTNKDACFGSFGKATATGMCCSGWY